MTRTLFGSAVAGLFALLVAALPCDYVLAQSTGSKLAVPQPGYYRQKLGDLEVIALSDGTLPVAKSVLHDIDPKKLDKLLSDSFLSSPMDTSVNAYVFKAGSRVVMIDTGVAELYGPNLGKLAESLRGAGFEPAEVTDVFVTHVHPDHIGGLSNGSTRVFPNAKIHIENRDIDYWLTPGNADIAPKAQKPYFAQASEKLAPYQRSGQIVPFDGAVEFFPGFKSVPAPGHTPGHVYYSLESHGERLMFWADILHVADVEFAYPSATVSFDVDPKEAARQRKLAFGDAAKFGYMVAPSHLSFPSFGHVRVVSGSFRFYRVSYINDAKR